MNEYTFLLSKSYRTAHVKAKTLRQAWQMTKKPIATRTENNLEKLDHDIKSHGQNK